MSVPCVKVGIFNEPEVKFVLYGKYRVGDTIAEGECLASVSGGKVLWDGKEYDNVLFTPSDEENDCFELKDVTIGVNFHWERKENQKFRGALSLIVENDRVTAINVLSVEEYLLSVISSEMSATASLELLKAHAVISRSWLLAQIEKNKNIIKENTHYCACHQDENELVKWYDREDHVNFDVCADDHCQRYQGITRASTQTVREAIKATWGQVLTYDGKLCDARFSKCCGGVYEEFENCWEPVHYPYLVARRDSEHPLDFPDLTVEENAKEWILSSPQAFCNTTDAEILSQVLNNYDQETADFYRWKVEYSQEELSALIKNRSGIDYGEILDLVPVERGKSGRLVRMKIVGTKKQLTIGKELEIRRTLSPSHLYSSAFIVDKQDVNAAGVPQKFVLTGAGWGHGVGLCQIGAAVMGAKGYNYKEILLHYFIDANISTLY
ncbi:MAG: SpoIID/LytB domain-containing protein [Bacteroidales bacterium]|nr:SpoIID/LytB domain-containing protein [Bacteroidales bacterium]MDD7404375.1 SpoIID/LytB domain-containing protein [Bacteroidales bacterium]MDY2932314.1 SpoIID/LytB domain-containing protein [Muribaculaceae bacterium]MDY4881410.1 SpoIID/LytB domain-containing protein [Muribaculaceae bacterium]MDY5119746.1 SpoIID/LytB domain-containing protein [Muribaculaceae bacterium]